MEEKRSERHVETRICCDSLLGGAWLGKTNKNETKLGYTFAFTYLYTSSYPPVYARFGVAYSTIEKRIP